MEIILGEQRSKTNPHILSEYETTSNALLFRNKYSSDFSDRVCFFKVLNPTTSFTCDRQEFIGSNSSPANPQGLYLNTFSGRVGSGIDSCGAIQSKISLIAGEETEVVFLFGSGKEIAQTDHIINQFKQIKDVNSSIEKTKEYWKNLTNKITIQTPDLATNSLFNGWLSYQTISCRLFARSGFYQSGGAFGFRDQLQDSLAIMKLDANLARKQILLAASRQFPKGDVQHWWHPPAGRGVRTRCSDDLLWLPYVICEYLETTGDSMILDEDVGFIEMRELYSGEESNYDLPTYTSSEATIYEHAVRAIQKSLVYGRNGLPLIGSGDWNDGMDQVGIMGSGESVWLGFFLYSVLIKFGKISESRNDREFMEICREHSKNLKKNIESNAWDGEWYNRAFYDDGTVIGSKKSDECKIDSISQSWSVISGLGDKERQLQAMESMSKHLVNRELNLILLLHPPFDKTKLNPGYIKGYIPGVRENGGQYTHSAVWAMIAFARLKDHDRVWELLRMINPINHSIDFDSVDTYKVEPYVMPADIYANELHEGRGGWTWYTGSSALMHSFILESLVGMKIQANKLEFNPCFPKEWDSVLVQYRFGESIYKITVKQVSTDSDKKWSMDGESDLGSSIQLVDDGKTHEAIIFA